MAWSALGWRGHLDRVGTDPIPARPIFLIMRNEYLLAVQASTPICTKVQIRGFGSVGRLRRPPPPMVLGWKYLHSMQRFWGAFWLLVILIKMTKMSQNLCIGWGFWAFLPFLAKWPKLAACLTTAKSRIVRHAASFGILSKNEPKLAACLTICRQQAAGPAGGLDRSRPRI